MKLIEKLKEAIKENGREAYEATLSEKARKWKKEIEEKTGQNLYERYINGFAAQCPERQVLDIAGMVLGISEEEGLNDEGNRWEASDEELQAMIEAAQGVS